MMFLSFKYSINPFTPIGNQDRISPYYINIISNRQVMRIKKNITWGKTLVDSIPDSRN